MAIGNIFHAHVTFHKLWYVLSYQIVYPIAPIIPSEGYGFNVFSYYVYFFAGFDGIYLVKTKK